MAESNTSFYLAPACWNYKNGDKIFGATVMKNVREDFERNRKKSIIYYNAKDSHHNQWHEARSARHGNDIVHQKRSFNYQYSGKRNYTKTHRILFTDVLKSNRLKNNLWNTEKLHSMPSFNIDNSENKLTVNFGSKSCHQIAINSTTKANFVVNTISNSPKWKFYNINTHPKFYNINTYSKLKYKVYRCQFNTKEESCCCSCNSDAMFEVMKSLYDCYKKKNCDNCNCILCGHLPREERRLGELRKSDEKLSKKLKLKSKASIAIDYEGKSPDEKKIIFREMAMSGVPLPEGKSKSEKELIKKVRTELGLPQEALTSAEKKKMSEAYKAGLIIPLEGKTTAEKEKILTREAELGIPLPEGRTSSEKALIEKVKASVILKPRIPSEKLREAKAAGLLSPLEGKSSKQKENILKGLAMQGIPLPEASTSSDQKLMDKVRAEVGLPPEPKTRSAKEKYDRAMAAGMITPLEGKSIGKKEKILRDQARMGLPLPEGRTPSEKALIAKVKETTRPDKFIRAPSEKLLKAKEAGLLTPLKGKSKDQKEKILRGLAMQGIPLPEAQTSSEQKLMNLIRTEVGLPPEPKSPSAKVKYNRVMAAGLITPLEGKSAAKKEDILRAQAKMGIPLPEGRTSSEKALIAKIKATTKPLAEMPAGRPALPPEQLKKLDMRTARVMTEKKGPSDECICDLLTPESKREPFGTTHIKPYKVPSEKMRKAKAAGVLTPLAGKPKEQKEKILRGLAMQGIPLPEAQTSSEQKLMDKVRAEIGFPPEPKTPSAKEKYDRAMAAGIITPLEGKSILKKEKILRDQARMGLSLPEGRTPSEKALIAKVKETTRPDKFVRVPSEKLRKAKEAGLLTPLKGKSRDQKEKILKGLAIQGIPLPEAQTSSEQKLMDRIRAEVGLPPEPKTRSAKEKYDRAMAAGVITPLEGKSIGKKEKILRDQVRMGLPLPEGRTPSEKALIAKVKETTRPDKFVHVPSEKLRKAKAAGVLTPLAGKPKEQKEKILRGLAMQGIPLPEAQTSSEQKLMDRIRAEVGLPPEPKTPSAKEKYERAMAAGIITPLEGKSIGKKEKILRGQARMGLSLPEGRTPSEKALIAKVKETTRPDKFVHVPSEKLRKAKAAGVLTPLAGKPKEQKEKILRGLAIQGIPLPEAQTSSDQKLMDRIRAEVGLPPEPKTPSAKEKYDRAVAAGIITPLDGKSIGKKEKILRDQARMGLPLPDGRTPSEKALIAKVKETTRPDKFVRVPSEKLRKAKEAGLLTPLKGKSKDQKEKILKGLAMQGIPLPEAQTSSEQKLMDLIRTEVGLPPEPKSPSAKVKYNRAMAAGLITPLEGKSAAKKEDILRAQAKMGIPLPKGRTSSEKAMIAKIKATTKPLAEMPAGRPALPPEQLKKLDMRTARVMTEKKGPSDECICDLLTPESKREPFGITHIKPYKVPSEKMRKAKEAGVLTPLAGKPKEQKEKILRGLAMQGIPLPEAQTSSEQKLMDKVRAEVGLPPEPKTQSAKEIYDRAMAAGIITPLEGKSIGKKEKILRDQARMGLPLPEGRTLSEKALIAKVKETTRPNKFVRVPSEKLRKAKKAGLLTPLKGKSRDQKEKILKGLAMQGIPLPEAQTSSEKKLMDRIRAEIGLPPVPKTRSAKEKYDRAMAAGVITPLEGKSIGKKEKILRDQARMGLPLPEGRTPSEKALIAKVKETTRPDKFVRVPSEKLRKAKEAGLLTPLKGKSRDQKEKILKGLAIQGIPLPEAQTSSEQKLMDRIRAEVGLPPEPKTPSAKEKYDRAVAAGIITPLEGKSISKKEKILRDQARMGLPLPEGRTPSEKALIAKVKETTRPDEFVRVPSEKLRKAKDAGLLTPLAGKPKEQKEKILRGLAMHGIPLPEAQTSSEQKLMDRIRTEVGLPPEPKTPSAKVKYNRAMAAGLITPLEGKSAAKKEDILRNQARMGLPLPEGRTPSEKALIAKVKETTRPDKFVRVPAEKLRKAKEAGLLTPLKGKSRDQKEKILKGLAMQGIPLPEAQTSSEQKLMDRIRAEVGLPPEPKTPSAKENYDRAMAAGIITPLEGKSIGKKEKILRDQARMGLPLPEGRTPSEKALIAKVKETTRPDKFVRVPSEKLRKAKEAGLLTPLKGKSRDQKEKILKGLAMQGIPLPEAQTISEQKLMDRIRTEVGLPPEPKTPSAKEKYDRAVAAGIITPLEGKSIGKKEKILRDQARMGLPLPEGRTPSEKALIAKVKETTRPDKFVRVPSEKLRKAKEAGLLTPLKGKSRDQKEKILKGLAMQGIPLPEAQTISEQKLMDRIRTEVGLPPEPKTPSAKVKYNRAMAAGLITPLEGKSAVKKEDILRAQAEMGIPLPEGRTSSEKALIAKIKATTKPLAEMPAGRPALPPEQLKKLDMQTARVMTEKKGPSDECICDLLTPESKREPFGITGVKPYKVPSEKMRKAKAAGALTPLAGKPKEQKEKILRGLAMQGIPLPEAQTLSERKLMDRIRAEVGLPPEPKTPSAKEKYDRAMAAGIITPLEGKSIGKKEKILRDQARMGLPLPEGRTPSEKALIAKVKETTRPDKFVRVPSEKLRIAKEAGLLTPLKGKSKNQKDKILKGLAMQGIPLPEAQTESEQKLMDRIRAEVGLPPEPKTPSAKEKYNRAIAAGLITPLEGKSAAKKEEILREQAKMGLSLPEGRTPSEKALVAKIKESTKKEASLVSSKVSIPSEKLRQAKAAGLLTPLQGKPLEKKEKILTGLAESGLPLPKGKTPSEKSLIRKVQTRYGIPPKARTSSEKEIIRRAKAEGLLTPLKGKTLARKEKILKGLAEAGLPMPEGTTQSEKALVQKVRTMAGLPPEATPSEKRGKIKKRSKKIGVGEVSKSRKRVGISKSKGGVIEEFEDITKTTTCDRACGCDKKKIRFKHSYVKIRVTSPDISSLCPCPEECVPGVKGGVFTDNDGIKVTIGRVTGAPPFRSRESSKIQRRSDTCPDLIGLTPSMYDVNEKQMKNANYSDPNPITNNYSDFVGDFHNDDEIIFIKSFNSYHQDRKFLENDVEEILLYSYEASDSSSMESIYLIKSNSSTSLTAASDGYSILSFSLTETSSCSSYRLQTADYLSLEYLQIYDSNNNYCSNVYTSGSTFGITNLTGSVTTYYYSSKILSTNSETYSNREILLLEAIQSESYNQMKHLRDHGNLKPSTSCMNMNSNSEIFDTVNRVLPKCIFNDSSSLIIIMSTSSDEYDENDNYYCYLNNIESITFIQVSENCSNWNSTTHDINSTGQNKGFKLVTKGKNLKDNMILKEIDKNERQACNDNLIVNEKHYTDCRTSQKVKKTKEIFSNDTSEDRPCCCKTSENNIFRSCCVKKKLIENISPDFKTPIMLKEDVTCVTSSVQGVCHEALLNINEDRNLMIPLCKSIMKPTPVRLCEIPTCSGHTGSHRPTENPKPIIHYKDPCNKLIDSYRPADSSCSACPTPKLGENRKKVKNSKGKSGCPCSNYGYHGNPSQECDMSQANANMTKGEKLTKKNKNIVCECPEEQLGFQFDMEDWIDEAQIRKMKSDLTQTVSGFKLNILRKTPEPEMSFEEILKFYAEAYEQKYKTAEYEHIIPKTNKNAVDCRCPPVVEKVNKIAMNCRCPPVAEKVELPAVSDEPFQGIKFHIGGKGSGSKGLSGILCFQLLQEAGFDCTE